MRVITADTHIKAEPNLSEAPAALCCANFSDEQRIGQSGAFGAGSLSDRVGGFSCECI